MAYSSAIPVVDVEPFFRRDDSHSMQRALRQIRETARESGLFYLTGHKISPLLLKAVYLCSMHFFTLAEEFKNGLSTISGDKRYFIEKQYVFSGAKIAAADDFYPAAGYRVFPAGSHKRHPAIDRAAKKLTQGSATGLMELYYQNVFDLCRLMLEGCAIAQGAPADLFQCIYEHPVIHAQLMPWEPSKSPAASHSGTAPQTLGEIIILWADDVRDMRMGNLSGDTARPAALEGRFALRIADMMARWCNDLLISVPHRIVDNSGKENFWIPVFYDSTENPLIECAEGGCLVAEPSKRFSLVE